MINTAENIYENRKRAKSRKNHGINETTAEVNDEL